MSFDYSGQSGDAYHADRHRDLLSNPALYAAWSRYAERVYFPKLPEKARVLEVGAGLGANLASLASTNLCVAVEPSPLGRSHCERFCRSVFAELSELPDESAFDAILLRHVLEHVNEPSSMLRDVGRHLAPTGRIILVLPIENPFKGLHDDDPDHHLFCWNRQTAANLLEHTGYKVLDHRINWLNGRKLFLPVERALGTEFYRFATGLLGRLRFKSEMILWATRVGPKSNLGTD